MTDSRPSDAIASLKERLREYFGGPEPEKLFRRTVAVSVALHAALFAFAIAGPLIESGPSRRSLGPAVTVSLVDLPKRKAKPTRAVEVPAKAKEETAPTETAKAEAIAAPVAPAMKEDALYLKRQAEAKELAKLQAAEEARAAEEEARHQKEREQLKAALAALKAKAPESVTAAPKESPRSVEEIEAQLEEAARSQRALAAAEQISKARFGDYRARAQALVEKKWRVPANLLRRRELSAEIYFEIDADGTIVKAKLERSSGEAAFDDSVLRAAREVVSFETPPVGFPRSFTVRFNNRER